MKSNNRQDEAKLILKDREFAEKDYGHLNIEAERVTYISKVK